MNQTLFYFNIRGWGDLWVKPFNYSKEVFRAITLTDDRKRPLISV